MHIFDVIRGEIKGIAVLPYRKSHPAEFAFNIRIDIKKKL